MGRVAKIRALPAMPPNVRWLADLILGTGRRVYGADGVEIAVGDTVWAKRDGRKWTVVGFDFSKRHSVIAVDDSDIKRELKPEWLTHTEPDSWERLEEDAVKGVCEYTGAEPSAFGAHDCDTCRFFGEHGKLICEQLMALDIVRRAKKIRGGGGVRMTREEYERRRSEIVESYIEEIDEHESAGCHGDAEISRKWMRRKLSQLKEEYEEDAS